MMEDQQSASERVQRAKRQAFGKTPKVYASKEAREAAKTDYATRRAAALANQADRVANKAT